MAPLEADPEWDLGSLWEEGDGLTRAERLARMRTMLVLHRKLLAYKAEERGIPDPVDQRLAELIEELDPDDPRTSAICLIFEAERKRTMQYEELDKCIDRLADSFLAGVVGLVERLRPVEAPD